MRDGSVQRSVSAIKSPVKAMVLAAGEGTRLRPLTLEMPKALLPIDGVPLIQYTVAWLHAFGISEIAINLHHLGDKVRAFLGDGSGFGVKVVYSEEECLLGTAGGVRRMKRFLGDTFVVVYGDILVAFDLSEMISLHLEKNAAATMALFGATNRAEVGVVQINDAGRIVRMVEKPEYPASDTAPVLANAGVYVLDKAVLDHVPETGFCDFGYEVFPKLIQADMPVYGYRLKPHDYVIDIGTLDKYERANRDVKQGKVTVRVTPEVIS